MGVEDTSRSLTGQESTITSSGRPSGTAAPSGTVSTRAPSLTVIS